MKKKARELAKQRQEAERSGRTTGLGGGGFGSSSFTGRSADTTTVIEPTPSEPVKPAYTAPRSVSSWLSCLNKQKHIGFLY